MKIRRLAAIGLAVAAIVGGVAVPATADSSTQIIGGRPSSELYPPMSGVHVTSAGGQGYFCGGQLIHPRWVLTAGHCATEEGQTIPFPAAGMRLRIGSEQLNSGGVLAGVRSVRVHPGWSWGTRPGPIRDLALLELDQAVPLPVWPIPATPAEQVRLLGFGLTSLERPWVQPEHLQEQDTVLLPRDHCRPGFITTGEICVGGRACYGDSGGPALQRGTSTRWTVTGLTSRDGTETECGASVYTDLTEVGNRIWIHATIYGVAPPPGTYPPPPTDGAGSGYRAGIHPYRWAITTG